MLKTIQHCQEHSDEKIESLILNIDKLHGKTEKTGEKRLANSPRINNQSRKLIGEHEIAIRSLKRQIV